MKLTKPQIEELRKLLQKRQPTYGRHRSRVQNNLVYKKLARYINEDGTVVAPSSWGWPNFGDWCEITDAGREALKTAQDH